MITDSRRVPIARPHVEPSRETHIPKPIPVRPGSQDFLSCPSLRDGVQHEHRGPISLAGSL